MKKFAKKVLNGLSLTTAMFIFQACYGTPQDFENDLFIEGYVKSKSSGKPISGIKVLVNETEQYQFTDDDGYFSMYTYFSDSVEISLQDVDSNENGIFENFDTVMTNVDSNLKLNFQLKEK